MRSPLSRPIHRYLINSGGGEAYAFPFENRSAGVNRSWVAKNWGKNTWGNFDPSVPPEWKIGRVAGRVTDDTVETMAVMEALIAGNGQLTTSALLDSERAAYLRDWRKFDHPRAGYGSLQTYLKSGDLRDLEEVRSSHANRTHPGNAAPMRAMPIGFTGSHLVQNAFTNADATHPHLESRLASLLIAGATDLIFSAITKQGPAETVTKNLIASLIDKYGEWIPTKYQEYLQAVDQLPAGVSELPTTNSDYQLLCGPQPIPYLQDNFDITVMGMPADAIKTAAAILYLIKHTQNPYETLRQSICFGGDVDTLAAISGGMVAVLYEEDLPGFILNGLVEHDRELITNAATEFANALPF